MENEKLKLFPVAQRYLWVWQNDPQLVCCSLIHILVTSWPEIDIKSAIEVWARNEEIIPLQGQPVENDIKSYV